MAETQAQSDIRNRPRASRARPTEFPGLQSLRAAHSVLTNSPEWKHWSAERRFTSSYVAVPCQVPESPCHHWIGTTSDEGYGHLMVQEWRNGESGQAHHYAIERAGFGSMKGRRVSRSCKNTSCVNVAHLIFDTTPFTWEDPVTAPQLDGLDIPRRAAARFWERVDKERDGNCWWWTGKARAQGYGRLTIRQGWVTDAHRMAYALAYGSIPDGLHVCHGPECEEVGAAGRLCVNPAHLIADTAAANMADKAGGHFRRPLAKIPVSPETRRLMVEFLPHALSVLKEQGDYDEPGKPSALVSPLQPA